LSTVICARSYLADWASLDFGKSTEGVRRHMTNNLAWTSCILGAVRAITAEDCFRPPCHFEGEVATETRAVVSCVGHDRIPVIPSQGVINWTQ
jgi:hypothetical protein